MKRFALSIALAAFAFGLFIQGADAAKWTSEMKEGKPEFKSMGPLAFGPEGILFVADSKAAAIVATATGDTGPPRTSNRSKSKRSIKRSPRCSARAPIRF